MSNYSFTKARKGELAPGTLCYDQPAHDLALLRGWLSGIGVPRPLDRKERDMAVLWIGTIVETDRILARLTHEAGEK